jgi:O-antigen ligase
MLPVAYPLSRLRSAVGALIAAAVVGGAVAWGVATYVHWYDDRWLKSTEFGDVADRWTMVTALLRAWSRNGMSVVFGIGNSGSFSPSIAGYYPHNVPLEILGEEGVVGFALYLALVACVVRAVLQGVHNAAGDLAQRRLLAATLGCFLFTLIVSLKQGNAMGSVTFFMFAVLTCRTAAQGSLTHMQAAVATTAEPRPADLNPPFPNLMR